MASKPIILGEYKFKSKKEALELYREILNSATLKEPLTNSNFSYAMALLLNHPNAKEKIGNGIKSIIVDTGKYKTNRCFHVIREDESKEDFSIGKCINGDHSEFHKFCIAARNTIEEDMLQFKIKYFENEGDENNNVKCQIGGNKISKDEAHIDHREPLTFSSIVHFFIQAKNIDFSSISYITKGKYGNEFSDSLLRNEFKEWHKKNAKLRVIAKDKNLEKAYLGRIKSTKADGSL